MDKTLRNYLTGILSGTDRALETFIQVTADSLSEQQLTRLTGTGGVNDKPIAEGIYVSRPTGSQTSEEEDTASLEEQDDLMEPAMGVIQEKRRVVVLGNPGSGKTTLLQYLMLRMASECYQAEGTGDVPVYISLKDLTTKNTLHAILADYRNDVFYPLLVNGQVVFLLDGLNEVQPHCLEKTMDDIRQLLNDYPHCGLVITSRLYGYTGEFDLPVYCLDDFSEDNIREYTHHRTGNTALYERILETEGLHSMAVNPLLLNMITSIWLTEDDLPKQRSRLYARFIEFQLNRGCITRREEQHSIINVLSRLAYEMRVGGQVCDDLDRLIKVIAIEDRESDVSGMLALLNRSGLLVMTGTGTCTAGVSFVHETFQEYFCALYINKEYERTRYVPVDLSRPEWLETLKLIGEEVLQHGTESRIIEFLTQVAAMFANGSITGFFNDRLAVTVRALTGMADESQLVRDWLDQYVFFHMQNFLKMSDRQATDSRFAAIVESLGMLHSKGLCKALFLSSRWQQRWMYDPLHLDAMNYTRYSARLEQVIKNLPKFSGKKDICLYLYDFHKENNCFEGINRVISILKNILSRNLNVEECKEVFELTGDYCALFCCTDLDYIEQKTRAVPGIHVPGIKHVFEGLSPESLFFLYGRLYDRFCESDRQVLLSSGFLYKMVLKAPGLDEVLLRSPKIKTALTGFLRSLYRIPMEFLSPYYRTFLDELREETVHKETSMEFRTICQGPDGRFVVETKDKRFAAELPAVTNFVLASIPDSYMEHLQLAEFTEMEKPEQDLKDQVMWLKSTSNPGQFLVAARMDKIVYAISNYRANFRKEICYTTWLEGKQVYLQYRRRNNQNVLRTREPVNRTLTFLEDRLLTNEFFRQYSYLFRVEDMDAGKWKLSSSLPVSERLDLGIVGNKWEKGYQLEDFGVVVDTRRATATVHFRASTVTGKYPMLYRSFRRGQLVFVRNGVMLPVMDPSFVQSNLLLRGVLVEKSGPRHFIRCEHKQTEKDYFYFNVSSGLTVGDEVFFFPLYNTGSKFVGEPLVGCVWKNGTIC